MSYGKPPVDCGAFEHINLNEVMYYLYLPVCMPECSEIRLPPNIECLRPMIQHAQLRHMDEFGYHYVSARKGWATPDNPLNRPGWHCDGFGGPDMNYVWWSGASTRFWVGDLRNEENRDISADQLKSMEEFEFLATMFPRHIETRPAKHLYQLDRYTIHATPELTEGQMRQYVKISFSNERYNLYGNSHNYLFDYDWPMVDRETVRNDTSKAQGDHS